MDLGAQSLGSQRVALSQKPTRLMNALCSRLRLPQSPGHAGSIALHEVAAGHPRLEGCDRVCGGAQGSGHQVGGQLEQGCHSVLGLGVRGRVGDGVCCIRAARVELIVQQPCRANTGQWSTGGLRLAAQPSPNRAVVNTGSATALWGMKDVENHGEGAGLLQRHQLGQCRAVQPKSLAASSCAVTARASCHCERGRTAPTDGEEGGAA